MDEQLITAHLRTPDGGRASIQGTYELVSRLITPFLKEAGFTIDTVMRQTDRGTFPLDQNENVPNSSADTSVSQIPAEIVSFYRKAKPENQYEEVLIIVYHLKHHQGMTDVSKEDIAQGYSALRLVPVKAPKDMKGAVRNTVDRTPWLRNADRGRYAVTLVGEEHIIEMLQR